MRISRLNIFLLCVIVLNIGLPLAGEPASSAPHQSKILFITLHTPGNPIYSNLTTRLSDVVAGQPQMDIDTLYVMENTDQQEFITLDLRRKFYAALRMQSYQLIVVCEPLAESLLSLLTEMHMDSLPVFVFSLTPISRETHLRLEQWSQRRPLSVLSKAPSFAPTLQLALKCFPKTVAVFCLESPDILSHVDVFQSLCPAASKIQYIPVNADDLDLTALKTQLSELPGDKILIATRQLTDHSTESLITGSFFFQQLQKILPRKDVYFFSTLADDLQGECIGGFALTQEDFANQMADQITRLLQPDNSEALTFRSLPAVCMINYPAFTALKLPHSLLPDHVVCLARPPSFWATNHSVIAVGLPIIAVLSLIIFTLLHMRHRLLKLNERLVSASAEAEKLRQLAQNESNRFRQTIESMADGVISTDMNQNILMVNHTAAQLLGEDQNALVGHPLAVKLRLRNHFTNQPAPLPTVRTLEGKRIIELANHIELVRPDGSACFISTSAAPIWDNQHQVLGCVLIFRDMTSEYDKRRQLESALEDSRAAERAKSFFLSTVSHEIRTPLNALLGFTELLQGQNVTPAETREYLNSIAYSGKALLQLICDVLDLSKLASGQMKVVLEPCDFRELGSATLRIFESTKRPGVLLLCQIPAMPLMQLDVQRIRQILLNLIGNAVKFTLKGSITLHAEWVPEAKPDEGTLSFAITDTGKGIAHEDQSKVMEPFVQLTQLRGTAAANQGTGLGLSICKRMVEIMDGELTLNSELGKGSTFAVTLHHVKIATDAPVKEEAPATPTSFPFHLPLLLVDDVKMNLAVLKAMCEKCGADNITLASSGAEAMDAMQKRPIAVVFTDLWMPEINGEELARRIRTQTQWDNTRIVAVTADADIKTNFSTSLFDDILLKPVSKQRIIQLFQRFAPGIG